MRRNYGSQTRLGLGFVYANVSATGHPTVEQLLSDMGIRRRIVLRLAHFTVAPEIVGSTDLAVIFPRSVAERINHARAFRLLPLTLDLPPIEVGVDTHRRFASDLGIAWLRTMLVEMFAEPAAPG